MAVDDFSSGDAFIFRVFKSLTTNPDNVWVNNYEFIALEEGGTAVLLQLGDILLDFETRIHSELVQFDRYTVSTWEADSVPYDPAAFVTIPTTLVGLRSSVPNEVVPLGEAWRVNRICATGRFGNLFYRGALYENEVSQPAGIPILSEPADLALILSDAIDDSLLTQYFGLASDGGLYMAMINFTGTQRRPVTQLISGGVSLIKADHQWFNRTSSPS